VLKAAQDSGRIFFDEGCFFRPIPAKNATGTPMDRKAVILKRSLHHMNLKNHSRVSGNAFGSIKFFICSILSLLASVAVSLAATGDENWDGRFGVPGAGEIRTILVDGNDLYVGGQFSADAIGGVRASYIAKWNGTGGWSPFDTNLVEAVNVITVKGGIVYAGGVFNVTNNENARALAKWNGTNWTSLGAGVTNESLSSLVAVNAMAWNGDDLYVGGSFTKAGGVNAGSIARWDGTNWFPLGVTGLTGGINAIAVIGNEVYVAGSFTTIAGVSANSIAKWNGSSWSALGTGLTQSGGSQAGQVFALAVDGTNLYVGGYFTAAGGLPNYGFAKWDGTNWSQPGGVGSSGTVRAISVQGTNLYVSGTFTSVGALTPTGGVIATNIARWDGANWSGVGGGQNGTGYALAADANTLYSGGTFSMAGGVVVNSIGKWDGTNWKALGRGFDVSLAAVATQGTNVYVGGSFSRAGGVAINRIARWDGADWQPLGGGVSGEVAAIALTSSNLYAGGSFNTAGGVMVNRIAKWDGTNWFPMGSGVNVGVNAIAVYGNEVFIGGGFSTAGGSNATRIARWDGANWFPMGSGANGLVNAMVTRGNDLYVGGAFTTISGTNANRIARWDGTRWFNLGTGIGSSVVDALATQGDDVIAGGTFVTAGGVTVNNIARWNGSSWSALGAGVNGNVAAIVVSGNDIYAGGFFTTADGFSAKGIARWNGSAWSALGSGVAGFNPNQTSSVLALGKGSNGEIYVGGGFGYAGLKPASFFNIWHPPAPPPFLAGLSAVSGGNLVLSWPSQTNGLYQILSTTNLAQPFSPLGAPIPASGTNTSYTNAAGTDPARFLQIQQLQP
jgi:hypothetical protein